MSRKKRYRIHIEQGFGTSLPPTEKPQCIVFGEDMDPLGSDGTIARIWLWYLATPTTTLRRARVVSELRAGRVIAPIRSTRP
jgi:hypothetical protein